MLPSGRGGVDNFQARGVTKGQLATASKRLFDSAVCFFFITSNNLGQPWMALWKIDEEEGEAMFRGCWCVSVDVCLWLQFASPSKCRLGEKLTFGVRQFGKKIFFVAETRPQRLLAASLKKIK